MATSESIDRMRLQAAPVSPEVGGESENGIMRSHGVVLNQNLNQESMFLSLAPLETISTEDVPEFPRGLDRGPYAADFLHPLPSSSTYIFDFEGRATR